MELNKFVFRRGSVDDGVQLKELANIAYGQYAEVLGEEHWATMKRNINDEERFQFLLRRAAIFVCEDNGKIAGVAYLMPSGTPNPLFDERWSHIRMVGVRPEYGGMGIAKRLTIMCIDHARQTKETTIALHTSEFMNAARHIYESLGFKVLKDIGLIHGKQYWIYTLRITPSP